MRLRLILSFGLIVLISIIGVVLFVRRSTANEIRAFMIHGWMTGENDLTDELEAYYQSSGNWGGVEGLLEPYISRLSVQGRGMGILGTMKQRLRLADQDGNIIVDTSNPMITSRLSRVDQQAALELEVDGTTIGYLLSEGGFGYNRNQETLLLNRLNRAALVAMLIAGGIAILVALALAYQLLRPVQALTLAAEQIAQGDLSQRVPVHGNDELARLGLTFNHMADSLQLAQESRRAMTADIAHELRNPLAVQRANLEALQDGIYLPTPENLQPILDQNLLLTRMVDDLQILALADARELRLERTLTEIPRLVTRVLDRFSPQAATRQIELNFEQPIQTPPPIMADPMRVEQILGNLVSNALRYTPAGGNIKIKLSNPPKALRLEVQDTGPGIPSDALPYIFERFYRADRSRTRAEGGSGLGLSIARKLAEAHGGNLTAENAATGGALFLLTLPVL